MNKIRKSLIWLMTALLVCSFLPPGLAERATAASTATYFIPDDMTLRNTSQLTLDGAGGTTIISRGVVYTTINPTLTITGTFAYVSDSSMQVTVQQLTYRNNQWVPDPNRIVTGTVQRENGTTNRFTTGNLTLFPGFNRITFTGFQGNVERSESFYVLYDQVPYIENIVVYGSGGGQIQLNEGAQAVVDRRNITLQGQVRNATVVTVSLNGAAESRATLLENGMFTTATLVLKPGQNTLTIRVANNSDSIQVHRVLYLQDPDDPFVDLRMTLAGATYDVRDTIPTVTSGSTSTPNPVVVAAEVLLPWDDDIDADDIEYSLDGGTTYEKINLVSETVLPGSDGITPAHRIVKFNTNSTNYSYGTTGLKDFYISIRYDATTWSKRIRFNFQPGATVIKNMYLLPDFNENTTDGRNVSLQSKTPLNGVNLSSPDFYVLVKTDVPPQTPGSLQAQYLPIGTLNLVHVTNATGLASDDTEEVYKITGFANGQQQVNFFYTANAPYTVSLSFIAKQYIDIPNLRDGQTFEFDSRLTHVLMIEGEYIGFDNLTAFEYSINGVTPDPNDPDYVNNANYDVELDEIDPASGQFKFTLKLPIRPEGPVVYGQNTLVFTGVNDDGTNTRTIRKELRIYVIDTNVSTIARFNPVAVPSTSRISLPNFPLTVADDETVENIFRLTSEFAINDDRYVTSEIKYDLVIRGHGAKHINLKRGSETILYLNNLSAVPVNDADQTYVPTGLRYDFSGSEEDFILRVRDLEFEAPGTHVYNLELINETGARTSQRLEIAREQSSFRLLAPQPTVGNQIVVNKNFVRVDIEAEGATTVRIDGQEAVKRTDVKDRFYYDYTGLKPNKWNDIKIEIVRTNSTLRETISVYYTGEVKIDAQYMEALKSKHSLFNKKLELSFPRGTVLMSAIQNADGVYKYYTDTKLLFGIADPKDGVVERRNDYGHVINTGSSTIQIPNYLIASFNSAISTGNFTRISDIYWISGGMGEYGNKGDASYKQATNGLPPYSLEGNFATSDFEPERKVVPSQRGTLTLTFDENVVEDAAHTVTVFRYTDKGYWENIGGEVDTKKHTITVPFDEFGYYMVAKMKRSYTDIVSHPWARNILNGLYSKGIMTNLRYDEFGADDLTTRGEFVTLLVKGLNLPINADENNTFTDIQPGTSTSTWSYEYIETAARAGIVTGRTVGFFGSEIPISREEAAVMIARALELKLAANDSKLLASLEKTFLDATNIETYARPAVDAVYKAKIMTGSDVTIPGSNKPGLNFNPKSSLTRAEAGAIVVRMLQKSTAIFPKNLG